MPLEKMRPWFAPAGRAVGATINTLDTQTITSAGQNSQLATPWYSEQVLPFDTR